ncbi:tight adherence pilus pseudopilin TadF [Marinomonas sp. 2405UD66-6]|uniref:tight adherence pilus pseudopilin TadF n=1 Tax=Marinomonas sp. 2405UD66-6 TaxID=3391834 RepID=UPI0039C9D0FB
MDYKNERGNFTVEFAIVGVFFALLLVFSADIAIKLSVKGKLDRMSYSAVGIIKERSQLFSESSFNITESDFTEADAIIQASLNRTMGNFNSALYGSVLEVQTFDESSHNANELQTYEGGNVSCDVGDPLSSDLSVVTSWGRMATLYRVTLCYETDNLFGTLVDTVFNNTVSSNAVAIGR